MLKYYKHLFTCFLSAGVENQGNQSEFVHDNEKAAVDAAKTLDSMMDKALEDGHVDSQEFIAIQEKFTQEDVLLESSKTEKVQEIVKVFKEFEKRESIALFTKGVIIDKASMDETRFDNLIFHANLNCQLEEGCVVNYKEQADKFSVNLVNGKFETKAIQSSNNQNVTPEAQTNLNPLLDTNLQNQVETIVNNLGDSNVRVEDKPGEKGQKIVKVYGDNNTARFFTIGGKDNPTDLQGITTLVNEMKKRLEDTKTQESSQPEATQVSATDKQQENTADTASPVLDNKAEQSEKNEITAEQSEKNEITAEQSDQNFEALKQNYSTIKVTINGEKQVLYYPSELDSYDVADLEEGGEDRDTFGEYNDEDKYAFLQDMKSNPLSREVKEIQGVKLPEGVKLPWLVTQEELYNTAGGVVDGKGKFLYEKGLIFGENGVYEDYSDHLEESDMDELTDSLIKSFRKSEVSLDDVISQLGLPQITEELTNVEVAKISGLHYKIEDALNDADEDRLQQIITQHFNAQEKSAEDKFDNGVSFEIDSKGFDFDTNKLESGKILKGTLEGEEVFMNVKEAQFSSEHDLTASKDGVVNLDNGVTLISEGGKLYTLSPINSEFELSDLIPTDWEQDKSQIIRDVLLVALVIDKLGVSLPNAGVDGAFKAVNGWDIPKSGSILPGVSSQAWSVLGGIGIGYQLAKWVNSEEITSGIINNKNKNYADLFKRVNESQDITESEKAYQGEYKLLDNFNYVSLDMNKRGDKNNIVEVYVPSQRKLELEDITVGDDTQDIIIKEVGINNDGSINWKHTLADVVITQDMQAQIEAKLKNQEYVDAPKTESTKQNGNSPKAEAPNTSTETASEANDSISHLSKDITDAVDFLKDHKVTGNFKTIELGVVDEGGDNIDVAVRKMPDNSYKVMIDPDGWANSESAKLSANEFSKPNVEKTIDTLIKKFRAQ